MTSQEGDIVTEREREKRVIEGRGFVPSLSPTYYLLSATRSRMHFSLLVAILLFTLSLSPVALSFSFKI